MYSETGVQPCKNCPAGTFCGQTGCTECTECPVGKYSWLDHASAFCLGCDPGTYNDKPGQATDESCIKCAKGKYQASVGQTSCDFCPEGRFGNETGLK